MGQVGFVDEFNGECYSTWKARLFYVMECFDMTFWCELNHVIYFGRNHKLFLDESKAKLTLICIRIKTSSKNTDKLSI